MCIEDIYSRWILNVFRHMQKSPETGNVYLYLVVKVYFNNICFYISNNFDCLTHASSEIRRTRTSSNYKYQVWIIFGYKNSNTSLWQWIKILLKQKSTNWLYFCEALLSMNWFDIRHINNRYLSSFSCYHQVNLGKVKNRKK